MAERPEDILLLLNKILESIDDGEEDDLATA